MFFSYNEQKFEQINYTDKKEKRIKLRRITSHHFKSIIQRHKLTVLSPSDMHEFIKLNKKVQIQKSRKNKILIYKQINYLRDKKNEYYSN